MIDPTNGTCVLCGLKKGKLTSDCPGSGLQFTSEGRRKRKLIEKGQLDYLDGKWLIIVNDKIEDYRPGPIELDMPEGALDACITLAEQLVEKVGRWFKRRPVKHGNA